MKNQMKQLLISLQQQLSVTLQSNRETLCHSVAKGDATEDEWICLLKNHLPNRYQVDRAFVIDSEGNQSEQIDVVIYDRQYTPLLYNQNKQIFVPAESVYAIFEVKQELDKNKIEYAGEKIESVRNLKRTSATIVDVGKNVLPRSVTPILGGLMTSDIGWKKKEFGKPFENVIKSLKQKQRIDLGIALSKGSFDISYLDENKIQIKVEEGETALLYFFFNLLWRLQKLGTVPAIDYAEYLKVVDALS